jgi:hypothetical protein
MSDITNHGVPNVIPIPMANLHSFGIVLPLAGHSALYENQTLRPDGFATALRTTTALCGQSPYPVGSAGVPPASQPDWMISIQF